jgi:hypothetical protein
MCGALVRLIPACGKEALLTFRAVRHTKRQLLPGILVNQDILNIIQR